MNANVEKLLLFFIILTDVNRTVWSFDSKCPPLKLVNGRIRYRLRGRSVRFNCMKGFQLVGEKYATCMNGDWDTNVPICVKYGCRAPKTTHINGQFIESYRGAVVKIVCNPGYTLLGSPSVYCNGYRWNETFPVCRVTNLKPALWCDFESEDLCGWTQDPMHDFNWERRNGSAPFGGNVSEMFDHTKGANDTGHYMSMNSSDPKVEEYSVRLYSPVYPAKYSNGTCFKLWYRMSEPTVGVLKVYVKPEGVEFFDLIPSLWINEERESSWVLGFFHVEPVESLFQIVIEGVKAPGREGVTAFDDVMLTSEHDCPALEDMMTSTTVFSASVNPEDDVIDLFSCRNRCNETEPPVTFEEDACSCYNTCDYDGTCCRNYFEMCAVPHSSTASQRTQTETTYSELTPTTSPEPLSTTPSTSVSSTPVVKIPVPEAPKGFNNESNEIEPGKARVNLTDANPDRGSNEIPKRVATTTKATPKPRPVWGIPANGSAQIPRVVGEKVPKIPERNSTPNEIPRREVPPRTAPPATNVTRVPKNPKPNNIKLTFLDKPSAQSNESRFRKGKSNEPGKDTPQAIKIDKDEESGKRTLRIIEIVGTSVAVLVFVVLGIVWYRRRQNRKSERQNMVEDSDSIVYDMNSSAVGCESHSLVGIRPGALQPSADPKLFE